MAERSPIWGNVDIERFCRVTGYSREHATRELTNLRKKCDDLAFETKMRTKQGKSRKVWGVIVTLKEKLKYDKQSLFYGKDGKQLHNRTKLGPGGEKIPPSLDREGLKNSSPSSSSLKNESRVCDNPKKKVSFGKQQFENSAERKLEPKAGLKAKAFALLESIQWEHWDNCKVRWNSKMAYCYLYGALEDGHEEQRIMFCYQRALTICHAYAVDQGASKGSVVFFSLSSTVSKARKMLLADGMSSKERIVLWYQNRERELTTEEITTVEEKEELVIEYSAKAVDVLRQLFDG